MLNTQQLLYISNKIPFSVYFCPSLALMYVATFIYSLYSLPFKGAKEGKNQYQNNKENEWIQFHFTPLLPLSPASVTTNIAITSKMVSISTFTPIFFHLPFAVYSEETGKCAPWKQRCKSRKRNSRNPKNAQFNTFTLFNSPSPPSPPQGLLLRVGEVNGFLSHWE